MIGEIAHIVAHGDKGPRANPSFPAAQRDRYENLILILLCPTDHSRVDIHENTFTVVDLRKWKTDHERWVRESLAAEIPAVGFAELEIVTKALLGAARDPVTTFTITNPALKMTRNDLTERIHFLMTMGLAKAREVEKFVTPWLRFRKAFRRN